MSYLLPPLKRYIRFGPTQGMGRLSYAVATLLFWKTWALTALLFLPWVLTHLSYGLSNVTVAPLVFGWLCGLFFGVIEGA